MISWDSPEPIDGSWSLFDMNGRLLQQQILRSPAGLQQLELNLEQLPAGIYVFRLQTAKGQFSTRISKL